MSDDQGYATGGRVAAPDGKFGVQLGEGCCWWIRPREPDGSMRIESARAVLTLRPDAVDQLLEQIKNGLWPMR